MAVRAAPILPTAPTQPHKGAAVLILTIQPADVVVFTRALLPAPAVGASINLSSGQAV
jgi:hypothetical protein